MSKHRFSTGLTETSSRKVFHDGCAKRDIFSQQILNKNRLCLAHCALNRSFTVFAVFAAGDSDSPISIVPHLKLTYMLILNEPYSIEKCATCLDTFLRF